MLNHIEVDTDKYICVKK